MLGKVFRKKGINLIYGENGLGKTVSTVMALNEESIVPILLDFDNNDSPTENSCSYTHVDGYKYIKVKNTAVIPTGETIIIDTWQTFLDAGGNMLLLEQIRDAGNTVIIIAHNKPIATKRDIPDMDSKYANHLSGKLFLEYKPATSKLPESTNLTIMKLRGYKGDRVIKNWMR